MDDSHPPFKLKWKIINLSDRLDCWRSLKQSSSKPKVEKKEKKIPSAKDTIKLYNERNFLYIENLKKGQPMSDFTVYMDDDTIRLNRPGQYIRQHKNIKSEKQIIKSNNRPTEHAFLSRQCCCCFFFSINCKINRYQNSKETAYAIHKIIQKLKFISRSNITDWCFESK